MKQSQKKVAIMQTAEKLFYQHGFHAIGVKKILEQADVATMTMYYHFNSKEALIKDILLQREQRYFQFLAKSINQDDDVKNYLESLVQAHLNWIETHGANGCLFLRAQQEYAGINEEITTLVSDHKGKLLAKIDHDLQSFNTSADCALQLTVILEGATALAQTIELNSVTETAFALLRSILK
ncbi:TetR/AcrR family transcriptional regulator [Amphibacillus marinus]|uniref:TetR/AcrR family transcriptional regulator n=1 Tax=Amphibacillus marinus TaxID=872970 RepID=UPI000B832BDB|nr:TetR/AcrR family transcriptional regulator [Amphibacillus marinus]